MITKQHCLIFFYLLSLKLEAKQFFILEDKTYIPEISKIEKIKEKYKDLNTHQFFKRDLLVNTQQIKNICKKLPEHTEFTVKIADDTNVTCSLFSRNSKNLIVVGPGLTNQKEKMVSFAAMFPDYDVLLINFRGHTLTPLGVNLQTRLGAHEEEDVKKIVEYVQENFNYKKIIGLGICFGGYNIAKAQALAEKNGSSLFDLLIVDGCWLSLEKTIDTICCDPYLIISPQKGGNSIIARFIMGSYFMIRFVKIAIAYLLGIEPTTLRATDWLQDLKHTPILFIHSRPDLVVSWEDFLTIFESCGSINKAAWVTDHAHVINHLKSKELYAHLVTDLVENNDIRKTIQDISNLENEALIL